MSDDETPVSLGDSWERTKQFINRDRFKVLKNNYKFDKFIFQIIMYGLFGFMFFIAYSNNFDLDYYNCIEPPTRPANTATGFNKGYISNTNEAPVDHCLNRFYEPADWKHQEYLPPGEYGIKPTFFLKNGVWICLSLFMLGLLLNHLIYNKTFFKKRR